MRKRLSALVCILLTAALLCSCSLQTQLQNYLEQNIQALLAEQELQNGIAYKDITYTRPDMGELEEALKAACTAAAGSDLEHILDSIDRYYDKYNDFYTNCNLADIRYCADLTDSYWESEYQFFVQHSTTVDAGLETLYSALAKSPCRDQLEQDYFGAGYFDPYETSPGWDEEITALFQQESQLQSRYYQLSEQISDHLYGEAYYNSDAGQEMISLLVELIALRQQIADYWGYDDYPSFASDFYYSRDYTTTQTTAYLQQIQRQLVVLYRQVQWDSPLTPCSEEDTFSYVGNMARAMGGTVANAFARLERGGLYDIGYGANKYNSSFEVYLTSYDVPFIFMNPAGNTYDYFTFAHEFGHFCNDYASHGSYCETDVAEFFSQGMEYLSLCYGDNTQDLTRLKLLDCLSLYVEQAAFARFEQEMYALSGDALTAENLCALYDRIARDYGLDSVGYDNREFITITHYYTNPLYIISYIVSNDAALQLYQLEMAQSGQGLACLEENLDTQCVSLLEFLQEVGLESPFASGRLDSVRKTLEAALDAA